MDNSYIGRFAPSPTGRLHYGSLVAALASYLDARHFSGSWLLRIEDLDPPRESTSAPGEIIEQLKAFNLNWDGEILFQSTRLPAYEEALAVLHEQNQAYACTCSRNTTPAVYPGTCRAKNQTSTNDPYAVRLKLGAGEIAFEDGVFGAQKWDLQTEVGDFIIRRKDKLFAYQFAVAIDDDYQNVTHVVRGADLLDSTPKQLALLKAFGMKAPEYVHIPILVDRTGAKLSKQSHAPSVSTSTPLLTLRRALTTLGQGRQNHCVTVSQLLLDAARDWRRAEIPKSLTLTL